MPSRAARALRRAADILLWMLAAVGVVSGAVWIATLTGAVQPLVVVSGSMQPGIRVGDLLFATPTDPAALEAGDVATLRSATTGRLVTHRIIHIEKHAGAWEVHMRGDANDAADAEVYRVEADAHVWTPVARIPVAGQIVATIARPGVAIPLLVAIAALIALALLPAQGESGLGRAEATDQGSARPTTDALERSETPAQPVAGGG